MHLSICYTVTWMLSPSSNIKPCQRGFCAPLLHNYDFTKASWVSVPLSSATSGIFFIPVCSPMTFLLSTRTNPSLHLHLSLCGFPDGGHHCCKSNAFMDDFLSAKFLSCWIALVPVQDCQSAEKARTCGFYFKPERRLSLPPLLPGLAPLVLSSSLI